MVVSKDKGYDLITVIVEYGKANAVVAAAFTAGAQGATIHPARGVGVRLALTGGVDMGIDSDKEMVLVVTDPDITEAVYESMIGTGKLREWGKGFGYVQRVLRAVGFLKED